MTDYTARNVLLKDSSGNYLIPYTEKADLSLGNLNSAGKAYVAIKGYDSTATYSLNEVVMAVVSGSVLFYRSLADNNTASLSDTTKWIEVDFGGGSAGEINTPFFFGQSMYSENVPYNASWLVSNGSYNASTLYPDFWVQLTGVELNNSLNVGDTIEISGKTYVKRGLPVVLSTGTITDYDFVVNQNDQTFRLPLLNGERVLVKKYVNGSDWYNLYSDGWLEQGGYLSSVPSGYSGVAVTFFKSFSNTDYFSLPSWGSVNYAAFAVGGRTTTGMSVINRTNDATACFWKACGYAPVPTQADFTEVSGLYYYVGDTVQDASLINAGAILGQLANKADIDLSNLSDGLTNTICATTPTTTSTASSATPAVVVENYRNGDNGYVKFSDGFILQYGQKTTATSGQIAVTFLTPFSHSLSVQFSRVSSYGGSLGASPIYWANLIQSLSLTGFTFYHDANNETEIRWMACGY